MTQKEIANRLEIHQSALSGWLIHTSCDKTKTVEVVRDSLRLTVKEILRDLRQNREATACEETGRR